MIELIDISGSVAIQDAGRKGWQRFGVPVSGAMDWFAYQAANRLVGNDQDQAAIEIGLGEVTFCAHRDCVIAVTGAGYEALNYVWTFPLWTSFFVRAGWNVSIKKAGNGNWAYLAIAGGFDIENILGSKSSYLRGKIGNVLETGTRLNIGDSQRSLDDLSARSLSAEYLPGYSQTPVIDVVMGPQAERFTRKGLQTFLESEYTLSASFDRMGYRLEGAAIAHKNGADMISEGMTMGSVQVPANGQPIVMMADSPTTGGYPKIANVARASLPALAQCVSGTSSIRFKEVTINEAQEKYRKMFNGLSEGVDES